MNVAPQVLVIDDEPTFRRLVRHRIKANWPEARITEYDPAVQGPLPAGFDGAGHEVVLLDYHLGRAETGLDLLNQFVATPGFPPVVMLTGGGDERLAVTVIKAGAQDYLVKREITHAGLIRVIEEAVTRYRGRARQAADDEAARLAQQFQLRLPQYALRRVLGRGATAVALLAEPRHGGEPVVIKVLLPVSDDRLQAEQTARLQQEYALVSQLRHPGLARIDQLDIHGSSVCIVMEYFPGGTLLERIERAGPLGAVAALALLRQLTAGLAVLHAAAIIHRDIKPANIMLRADGSAALIDFGTVKQLGSALELTQMGTALGTPLYMAPEQGAGGAATPQGDLYALGVTFFAMLTGNVPYSAATPLATLYKHQHAPIPLLPPALGGLQKLLEWLLAKDPAQRPASAAALLDYLDAL